MIPQFPNFKNIDLADQVAVENLTQSFPPYSDYNFISMWCWNTENDISYSLLNGNLVVEFSDYTTRKNFYSFLGNQEFDQTVETLFKYIDETEPEIRQLKLIPESTILNSSPINFKIYADRDNFDYIYSVEKIQTFPGSKLAAKRNYAKRFKKYYKSEVRILDLTLEKTGEQVKELFFLWVMQKDIPLIEAQHEFMAIDRFMNLSDFSRILPLGIFIENTLCAFWFLEVLNNGYAMSHFQKAKTVEYRGISAYLMQQGAAILAQKSVQFINNEQDLGIDGLREGKKDYAPVNYLKKFIIGKA